MNLNKKQIKKIFKILGITLLLNVVGMSAAFLFSKFIITDNEKIIRITAKLFSFPLFNNNKKLINDFLDILMDLKQIRAIILNYKNEIYNRNINDTMNKFDFLEKNIKRNGKKIGSIKINFIDKYCK